MYNLLVIMRFLKFTLLHIMITDLLQMYLGYAEQRYIGKRVYNCKYTV